MKFPLSKFSSIREISHRIHFKAKIHRCNKPLNTGRKLFWRKKVYRSQTNIDHALPQNTCTTSTNYHFSINVNHKLLYKLFLNSKSLTGVKKLNDECRRIHPQKSNKWDAAKDVLLVGKRLEILGSLQQTPQQYQKRANSYWSNGINESQAKHPHVWHHESTLPDYERIMLNMTADEIKTKLKEMGITTRVRRLKTLQKQHRTALQRAQLHN